MSAEGIFNLHLTNSIDLFRVYVSFGKIVNVWDISAAFKYKIFQSTAFVSADISHIFEVLTANVRSPLPTYHTRLAGTDDSESLVPSCMKF